MHFSERIFIDRRRNILITFRRSYEKVLQLWRSCVQPPAPGETLTKQIGAKRTAQSGNFYLRRQDKTD